jgi:hypothetical protein
MPIFSLGNKTRWGALLKPCFGKGLVISGMLGGELARILGLATLYLAFFKGVVSAISAM